MKKLIVPAILLLCISCGEAPEAQTTESMATTAFFQEPDSLQVKIDELNREKARLLKSADEANPVIVNLENEIKRLEKKRDSLEMTQKPGSN